MSGNRGFTVIEMMVVILIVAVLLALFMPAVQTARCRARRTECVNNLKQLALGLANYESVHGVMPFGVGGGAPAGQGRIPRWSSHSQLLAYLGEPVLYNALNFACVAWLADPVYGPPNRTAIATQVSGFLCPSDPDPGGDPYKLGHSSYRACSGTQPWNLAADSADGTGRNDGLFWYQSAVKLSAITDGTSNTAAFSERCLGSPSGVGPLGDHYMVDASPADCLGVSPGSANRYAVPHEQSGQRWGDGALFYTRYNHALPPNRPSCLLGGATDYGSPVVVSASSRHPGGVNLATVDGAVRFVKETIEPRIWQGIGTLAGGEVLSCDCY